VGYAEFFLGGVINYNYMQELPFFFI
jgi:hypothetical protein